MNPRFAITAWIERCLLVPSGSVEVLKRRHPARLMLAEFQQAGRRLRLFFCDDDNPNVPFRQIGEWFRELDFTLLVEAFNNGSHRIYLLAGLSSMRSLALKRQWL